MLKSGDGRNPYEIDFHNDDCPQIIWASESELIDGREIVARKCEACRAEYKLWQKIIEKTADETTDPITLYGDLAARGLDLFTKIIDFRCPVESLSAFDYALFRIAHRAIRQHEAFKIWQREKELKEDAGR